VAVVALNVVAMSLIGVVVARVVLRFTGDRKAAWFAFLACLLCYEVFAWARFAVSDITFAALVVVVFALSAEVAREPTPKGSRIAGAAAISALCLVFRPTGWLLIPLLCCTIVFRLTRRIGPAKVSR